MKKMKYIIPTLSSTLVAIAAIAPSIVCTTKNTMNTVVKNNTSAEILERLKIDINVFGDDKVSIIEAPKYINLGQTLHASFKIDSDYKIDIDNTFIRINRIYVDIKNSEGIALTATDIFVSDKLIINNIDITSHTCCITIFIKTKMLNIQENM